MKNTSQYRYVVESRVSGIPCLIGITWVDEDGFEFEVLDRKGYKAEWLSKKMTKKDDFRVRSDVVNFFKD